MALILDNILIFLTREKSREKQEKKIIAYLNTRLIFPCLHTHGF